jgi:argininosuccinate lyase
MKLWDKGGSTEEAVIAFTCGKDRGLDNRLALFDILGSMAHAAMLGNCGLITADESKSLVDGLAVLYHKAEKGEVIVGEEYEDIHSFVEAELEKISGQVARRLHTGRSRNDQVLTDIHLYLRYETETMAKDIYTLLKKFLSLGEKYKEVLMPGFTHMQPAMVSSFGLWYGAYAESLCDDIEMLLNASSFASACPLGTAAGYGSSLPINRELTAELLGFERLLVNSAYSQLSRGKTERTIAQAIASAAFTISRFSNDVILFMSPGYAFVSMRDDLTTGSSIMPQKKNPDLFEIARARCNRLQALPNDITIMTAGLPLGYNRDFQVLKEVLFPSFDDLRETVAIVTMAIDGLAVRKDILNDEKYNSIFSVEEANRMVKKGIPFRDAYRAVAGKIGSVKFEVTTPDDYTHTGSIGNTGSGIIGKRADAIMERFSSHSPAELFSRIHP